MAFGEINNNYFRVKTLSELLPARGKNTYHAGVVDADKGHVRYSNPSSKHPYLTLVNPISDDDGNIILPGFYELILSVDRTLLILSQRGKEIAVIPVFKLEEDKSEEDFTHPINAKSQRAFDKKKKKELKKREKLFKQGKISSIEPEIYMNASLEYEKEGGYYLIKYERGRIRAWGAIK